MRSRIALLGLVWISLASCGSGSTEVKLPSAAETMPMSEALGAESPLDAVIGYSLDESEFEIDMAESVALCMKAEGFSDFDPAELRISANPVDYERRLLRQNLGAEHYANEHGLGYASTIAARFADSVATTAEFEAAPSTATEEAMQRALVGTELEFGLDGRPLDQELVGVQPGGCIGQALDAVAAPRVDPIDLIDQLAEMDSRIFSDPEILEMLNDWAQCMQNRGFPYSERGQMESHFEGRASSLLSETIFLRDDVETFNDLPEELRNKVELAAEREREAAVADFECSPGFSDRVQEIRHRYESDFVRSNAAALGVVE